MGVANIIPSGGQSYRPRDLYAAAADREAVSLQRYTRQRRQLWLARDTELRKRKARCLSSRIITFLMRLAQGLFGGRGWTDLEDRLLS